MIYEQSFLRDVKFDAAMVHANMRNVGDVFARGSRMTPDEWYHRTMWLSKQPKRYTSRVIKRVLEIESKT